MRYGPAYHRYLGDVLRATADMVAYVAPNPDDYGLTPAAAQAARDEITRDLARQARIIDPPRRFASA